MRTFNEYRSMYGEFYAAVKKCHEISERPHHGHGLDHDITVAQLAAKIAPNELLSDMAWCAGMLHSVDRMVDHKLPGLVADTIKELASNLYKRREVDEVDQIIRAAFRHAELNQDDQSLTQICLMDADRIANMQPAVVIRTGQLLPDKPAFEFPYLTQLNPVSTYSEPCSVLDGLRANLREYVPQLRMPKAVALGRKYAVQLQAFIDSVTESNDELGLCYAEL